MARMFPPNRQRPSRGAEPTQDAEWQIFEALRLRLGVDAHGDDTGEYIVFHGVKWFATLPNGGSQPVREMDFLIVSRRHGLLIIEAKGAKIALSSGRGGLGGSANLKAVGEAYSQGQKLEQDLTHVLLSAPRTCRYMASYQLGTAVWFPFSQHPWPRDDQRTYGAPNRLILDSLDLENPEPGILRAFEHLRVDASLTDDAIAALIETLDQTTPIMQARLSTRIPLAEARIEELTREQYAVLEALNDLPRLEVRGAAGTGKTVLAYEKSFRLAREGKRVLYVCSNPALSAWLRQMRDRDPQPENPYFDIYDMQELCALAPSRKTAAAVRQEDEEPDAHGAAQALSDLARAWRGRRERLYDAILVDEGQDFETPLWKPLLQLLNDPRGGLFYVFYDPAQRERDGRWSVDVPGKVAMHPLVINLRNTQEIFDLVRALYPERDRKPLLCYGAHGAPPFYIDPRRVSTTVGEDAEEAALSQALDRLIRTEGLRPEDVLIITCRPRWPGRYEQSRLFRGKSEQTIGGYVIAQDPDITPGKVALATIRLARGLERQAVILCELDGLRSTRSAKHRERVLYSSISRAKYQLVVLSSPEGLLSEAAALQVARS